MTLFSKKAPFFITQTKHDILINYKVFESLLSVFFFFGFEHGHSNPFFAQVGAQNSNF